MDMKDRTRELLRRAMKNKPRKSLRFEVHLCEHCNLNCKGCSHFSPLAEKQFLDPGIFERDIKRLSVLSNRQAEEINLLGGEPLLHPELLAIQNIARRYFDQPVRIRLITNGLLLARKKEDFWRNCRDNGISVEISGYPVAINIKKIADLAEHFGVRVILRRIGAAANGGGGEGSDTKEIERWFKRPLDLSGTQNIDEMYAHCLNGNQCLWLENGKMATCGLPSWIRHFNRYFGVNLQVSDDDFVDIFKVESIEELLAKLARPIPFCRYCRYAESVPAKWEVSKKEMSEWL
jgi:hypothetical protein